MYRKAIGILLLNQKGNIVAFKRSDFDSWQGPEGGIEENEDTETAMYRELYEEVGVKKEDVALLNETKDFIKYKYGDNKVNKYGFIGQEKKFYLLKLLNENQTFKFDIVKEEIEFSEYKEFENVEEFLKVIPPFKKELYTQVLKEFNFIASK